MSFLADGTVRRRLDGLRPAGGHPSRTAWRRLAVRLAGRSMRRDPRLAGRLALAGMGAHSLEAHAVRKLSWAGIACGCGALLGGGGAGAIVLGIVLGGAAFRMPDILLARGATRRRAAIERDVPDLLDLVCAGVSSGLGPSPSLALAAERLRGPLGAELVRATEAVSMGARWADELDELAARTEAPVLGGLRAALIQTDRLGASLEGVLQALAVEARAERRARTEARARAAPVKLLFPLVLLILPAFLLLTVVPVVLATLRNL